MTIKQVLFRFGVRRDVDRERGRAGVGSGFDTADGGAGFDSCSAEVLASCP